MSYVLFIGQLSLSPRNPLTFDISPLPPSPSPSSIPISIPNLFIITMFVYFLSYDGRWTMDGQVVS